MSDPRDVAITEAQVQKSVLEVLELLNWKAYRVGQRNARGTMDAGVSDIIAFKPGAGVIFVEVKRPKGGKQSVAQRHFEFACLAAGVPYILTSDSHHLFATLVEMKTPFIVPPADGS